MAKNKNSEEIMIMDTAEAGAVNEKKSDEKKVKEEKLPEKKYPLESFLEDNQKTAKNTTLANAFRIWYIHMYSKRVEGAPLKMLMTEWSVLLETFLKEKV